MIPSFQVSADNLLSLLLYNEALCRVLYAPGSWAFVPSDDLKAQARGTCLESSCHPVAIKVGYLDVHAVMSAN
jgi:hypothetical protein